MFEHLLATLRQSASRKMTGAGLWATAGILVLIAFGFVVAVVHQVLRRQVGPMGADAILAAGFLLIAGILMLVAARYHRRAPASARAMPSSALLEIVRQTTALRLAAQLVRPTSVVERVGLGLVLAAR